MFVLLGWPCGDEDSKLISNQPSGGHIAEASLLAVFLDCCYDDKMKWRVFLRFHPKNKKNIDYRSVDRPDWSGDYISRNVLIIYFKKKVFSELKVTTKNIKLVCLSAFFPPKKPIWLIMYQIWRTLIFCQLFQGKYKYSCAPLNWQEVGKKLQQPCGYCTMGLYQRTQTPSLSTKWFNSRVYYLLCCKALKPTIRSTCALIASIQAVFSAF